MKRLLLILLLVCNTALAQVTVQVQAGTNVLRMPSATSFAQANSLVTYGGTETLTNKTLASPTITGSLVGTTGTGHSFTSTFAAPVNDNVHFLSLWPVVTSAGSATDLRALSIDAELSGSVDAAGVRSQRLRAMTSVGSSANVGVLQGSSNSQTHQGSGLVSLMSGYQGSMNLWGPGNATLVEYFRANVPNFTSTGRIVGETKGLAIYDIGNANSTGVYGAWVDDLTKPTASSAYGYWTYMNAGSGGKFAFYGAGTAPSYFRGNVGVNNTSPAAPVHVGPNANTSPSGASADPAVLVSRDISDATGAGSAHGYVDIPLISRSGAGTGYAHADFRAVYSGTSNYDHLVGVQSIPIYGSTGTLTTMYGVYHAPTINSGTVTANYGLYVQNPLGAGTLTSNYGVYVGPLTKGATNYAFYSAGSAPSYFGGNVGSGGTFDFALSDNSIKAWSIQNTSTGASAATRLSMVAGVSSGSIQLYGSGHSTPNVMQLASPGDYVFLVGGAERMRLSNTTLAFSTAGYAGDALISANADSGYASLFRFRRANTDRWTIGNSSADLLSFTPTAFSANPALTITSTGVVRAASSALVASGSTPPATGEGVEIQHDGTRGSIFAYDRDTSATQELRLNYPGGDVSIGAAGTVTTINGTATSTSTTTGALVVKGGVGVDGNLVQSGYARWTGNSTLPGQGSVGKSATYGLNLYAATGSSYDFALFNAAGSGLLLNPTGTTTLTTGGNLNIGGTLGSTDVAGRMRVTSGGFASYGSLTLGTSYPGMGGGFQTSYDSPTTRIFYGDGSGFDLRFSTRVSSTTTDRITFSDTGSITATGNLTVSGTGTHTFSGTQLFYRTGVNTVGAASTVSLQTDAKSVGDAVSLPFQMRDSTDAIHTYGSIRAGITNATNGAEAGNVVIQASTAGAANTDVATFAGTGVSIPATTASTSTTTGALTVGGGVGVAGSVNAGGNLTVTGVQNVIGVATPSANFPLRIDQGATNAQVTLEVKNGSEGNSASAAVQLVSDAGSSVLKQHSSIHSIWPNTLLVGGSDAVAVNTGTTADPISFWVGGQERGRITLAGARFYGTTTNDSAAAGYVGEYVASTGTATSLTTATNADVTASAIVLSAGDWDVTGTASFSMTGATVTVLQSGVSTVSATFGAGGSYVTSLVSYTTLSGTPEYALPTQRFTVANGATATVRLVSRATFSAGTISAGGTLRARRVR